MNHRLVLSAGLTLCLSAAAPAQLSFLAAWSADSGQVASGFGWSVASAGDVNSDGFDDALVGAPTYTDGQFWEGRAWLYLGSPSGLATTAAWSVQSDVAFARFGSSVAGAGDVNGDGYDDVLVGAPDFFNGTSFDKEGRASLYLGSAAGLSGTAAWVVEGNLAGAHFGCSVAGAGDVNGDGFQDVLVGASGATPGGSVSLFHGSAAGLSPVASAVRMSPQANADFGCSVAGAGDVNGDGYDDVLVGACLHANGEADEGAAFLYAGSPTGVAEAAAWSAESNVPNARFGASVAGAGDVDGDGYDDVIIGAETWDVGVWEEGSASVFRGGAGGLAARPAWLLRGDQPGAHFGSAVAGAGDVNADGFDDVVVGAWSYAENTSYGRAFVFLGAGAGLETIPAWSTGGHADKPYLGGAVAGAFDVNGDGLHDVIAGGQNFDQGSQYAQVHHGGHFASVAPYGLGKGSPTKSAPRLRSLAPPVLGGAATLDFAKGEAGLTPFLIAGLQPAALPFDGGTLHLLPFSVVYLPPLPASGTFTLPVSLPNLPELQQLDAYFQSGYFSFEAPGPHHTFQTNGLHWTLGE